MKPSKTALLAVRVTPKTRQAFNDRAASLEMWPSEVLRILVDAFIENRVDFRPRVKRKPLES